MQKCVFTPLDWLHATREFMENHEYHTAFGQNLLLPKLKKNLALLKTKITQKMAEIHRTQQLMRNEEQKTNCAFGCAGITSIVNRCEWKQCNDSRPSCLG